MKRITLTADEALIDLARAAARAQHKTLNILFREWLEQLAVQPANTRAFDSLMRRLRYVRAGRRFTRAELNPE